jgi:hypothetical protein
MTRTTNTADAFAAAAAAAASKRRAANGKRSRPKNGGPLVPIPSRTIEQLREAEQQLPSAGLSTRERTELLLNGSPDHAKTARERARQLVTTVATNLRTIAEELEEIIAAAGEADLGNASAIAGLELQILDRRAAAVALRLARAAGLMTHAEFVELAARQGERLGEFERSGRDDA